MRNQTTEKKNGQFHSKCKRIFNRQYLIQARNTHKLSKE